ncbi:hypothetical protein M902_0731 [Bacteriovorax sp. BAL6_X]|nr:hypothetical protein M902_0731 [Bacteriovorax sp. BAL6_X]
MALQRNWDHGIPIRNNLLICSISSNLVSFLVYCYPIY